MSNDEYSKVQFPTDDQLALRVHPVEGRLLVQSGFYESQTCAALRPNRFGKLDFFGLDLALNDIEVSLLMWSESCEDYRTKYRQHRVEDKTMCSVC